MKSFNIPDFYRSPLISAIKEIRRIQNTKKKDFSPTLLDFGPVRFFIARHFGFCYGVEHAIEISYNAIAENHDKRIFLLSQMIHNQEVNNDLLSRGVKFLMDTKGNMLISWDELTHEDIVIIPAFGTTLEIEMHIKQTGVEIYRYNTTCPFVERVWKKAEKLGSENYTVIVHGKHNHEETRATFSRSELYAPSMIIKDMKEARTLGKIIFGEIREHEFYTLFHGRYSKDFNVHNDLVRVGIINQTTMLAAETQEIADFLKNVMMKKYGKENIQKHFADTRDTLCYATNENQEATHRLLQEEADFAVVVGGYNSSNTSHIVKLCEEKLPTYFISSSAEIVSKNIIKHFNFHTQQHLTTEHFIPHSVPISILLTSGASCPDTEVEKVLRKILSFFNNTKTIEEAMKNSFPCFDENKSEILF